MLLIYLTMIDDPADELKFDEIYRKYKGMMFRVANSVLKNKEDAEDALSEALLKLAKNIYKIRKLSCEELEGFLVTLSRNVAIDAYRKFQNKSDNHDFDEVCGTNRVGQTATPDVLTAFLSKEGYKRIVALIENMSDTYKDVMRLRFVFENSNDEIAEITGLTKTNVETRISRGRVILIEMLREEGYHVGRK